MVNFENIKIKFKLFELVVFFLLADVVVIINSTLVAIINNLHHICTTSFHAENGVLFNFHLMTIIFYLHAPCENFCSKLKDLT